jgi:hypothetical protein
LQAYRQTCLGLIHHLSEACVPFCLHRLQDLQGFNHTLQPLLNKHFVGLPSRIRLVKGSVKRFDAIDDGFFSPKMSVSFQKNPLVERYLRIPVAGSNTVIHIHAVIALRVHYVGKHRPNHIAHCVKQTKIFSRGDYKA